MSKLNLSEVAKLKEMIGEKEKEDKAWKTHCYEHDLGEGVHPHNDKDDDIKYGKRYH